MDSFKQRVFELTGNEQVFTMREYDLTRKVILPQIVKPYLQRQFISDDFMYLMADYGTVTLYTDRPYFGELLFEIAMQRISYCSIDITDYTPSRNQWGNDCQYFAYSDLKQPFNSACWNFIQKQAENMIRICGGTHMEKILLSLLDHLSPNGEVKAPLQLKDLDGKELFGQILYLIEKKSLIMPLALFEHWANPDDIIKYKNWFRKNWSRLDKEELIVRLGIEGTPEIQRRKLNAIVFS